jgi:hypothetical protein
LTKIDVSCPCERAPQQAIKPVHPTQLARAYTFDQRLQAKQTNSNQSNIYDYENYFILPHPRCPFHLSFLG